MKYDSETNYASEGAAIDEHAHAIGKALGAIDNDRYHPIDRAKGMRKLQAAAAERAQKIEADNTDHGVPER